MPINRNKLYEQIAQHIGKQIIQQEILPGEVLPSIKAMCVQYGVSHSVMREALKMLAAKGLVTPKQRIGVVIRPRKDWSLFDAELLTWRVEFALNEDFLKDLVGFRQVFEPGAASLAAQHAAEDEIEHLWEQFHRLEATIGDLDSFIAADLEFHRCILELAHNELVRSLARTLEISILAIIFCNARVPGAFEEGQPLHRNVVQAIADHDSTAAHSAMLEFFEGTTRTMDAFLNQKAAKRTTTLSEVAAEIIRYQNNSS